MNAILLIIRAITLLFRESQLPNNNANTGALVTDVLETIIAPDSAVGSSDNDRDMVLGLKAITLGMASKPEGTLFIAEDLLQKVRMLTRHDDSLHDALKEGIAGEMPEEYIRSMTGTIRRELTAHLREVQALTIIREQSRLVSYKRDEIASIPEFIANFRQALEQFETNAKEVDPAITGEAFLSDIDKVEAIFAQSKELNNDSGIMKTGWQAVNRMLQGGFRRGEEWVIGALQHNFKTGFTLSLFKHIAMYNTPYMLDPKKKPLLIRMSFEDPLTLNFPFLYRNIKENQTYEFADTLNTPIEEMSSFVQKELSATGYDVLLISVNPTLWGYRDVVNYALSKEAEGYEIHLMMLDYLNMLSKKGLESNGPMGSNIRELFRILRNFFSPRRTTLITPHQLSTEAMMLIRAGAEENFVKDVANRGYFDSCKTLSQEVDGELIIHKVVVEGKAFLTIARGKHRTINVISEELKYTVLPFHDIGTIRDDVNGKDTSRKRPNGPTEGADPGSVGFWNFDG